MPSRAGKRYDRIYNNWQIAVKIISVTVKDGRVIGEMPSEEIIKRATATKQPHEFSLTKLSSPPIFILRTLQDFKDPPISLQDLQQPIKICRL
jgi:hypothetical protein